MILFSLLSGIYWMQCGTGGPVIDHDGNVIGMVFTVIGPKPSILSISTILTCIEMWLKFRFVDPFCCCIDGIWVVVTPKLNCFKFYILWVICSVVTT